MSIYRHNDLSLESGFRSIYLFGRNVATYKFAFAKSLLELSKQGKTFLTLEELSPVFAKYMLEHIQGGKRQITSQSSKFIQVLELYDKESITWEKLLMVTERVGFTNVVDAFHNLPTGELETKFYLKEIVERKPGIRLTDHLYELGESNQSKNMFDEIEGRWNLVEASWTEKKPKLEIKFDEDIEEFFTLKSITPQSYMLSHERLYLTPVRKPLNGYQKGKCFYCYESISIQSNENNTCDIDHFIPLSIQYNAAHDLDLNGVWNLVLACKACNRGDDNGKFSRLPHVDLLARLSKRNEYLIESNHPLKETIMMKTGKTKTERTAFLKKTFAYAQAIKKAEWKPKEYRGFAF